MTPTWSLPPDRALRANPSYRLVPLAALPQTARRSLARAGIDLPAHTALLTGEGRPDKLVDAAGAELFAALREPGAAPPGAAALVLDGVLELETDAGFRSGPLAYDATAGEETDPPRRARLPQLAHDALAYAERLRLTDVPQLTARLYFFNRVPLAPRWRRAYPDASSVAKLLDSPALRRDWSTTSDRRAQPEWLSWVRRDDPLRARPDLLTHKLYVSPAVDELPAVLPQLAALLSSSGARRFKAGPDALGLLRPDKLVVYAAGAEELDRVARTLATALDGVAPHGVPFSADLHGDGLLSWGGDPPPAAAPAGGAVESWRLSVSRRLAEQLAAAQRVPLVRTRPREFALARLSLDGVDVRTFAPAGLAPPALAAPPAGASPAAAA